MPVTNSTSPITLTGLPGRDLDRPELLQLVRSLASEPPWLRSDVSFSDEERHYVQVHRDPYIDVWLLCWTPRNDTGWHDHDISSGAIAVVQGCLEEQVLTVGAPSTRTAMRAGHSYSFGPDHIHRLSGLDAGSVSVHAYSPPLWRLGQYTVSDSGLLRRTSVSYADELRPLRAAAV
jgi:predicted metal-dependent enzyme (double-stranded beta helix superfamily)